MANIFPLEWFVAICVHLEEEIERVFSTTTFSPVISFKSGGDISVTLRATQNSLWAEASDHTDRDAILGHLNTVLRARNPSLQIEWLQPYLWIVAK